MEALLKAEIAVRLKAVIELLALIPAARNKNGSAVASFEPRAMIG